MIEYILSVSLLIAAVMIIRAVFRKTVSPRVIYALWLVVVIRMVLPITLFEVGVTVPEVLHTVENSQTQAPIENMDPGNNLTENLPTQTVPIIPVTPNEAKPSIPIQDGSETITPVHPVTPPEISPQITPVQIINIIWLTGVCAVSLWVIFTSITYEKRLRSNRVFYKNLHSVNVYISKCADVPCVAGFIPSIYITPEVANNGSEHLIITHEYCHIRHCDHVWSAVRALALIVFWWNPLVWAAAVISKQDSELACDDAVSSKLCDSERIKYANILIDTIPQKRKYAVGLGGAPMKERIIMLTTEKKNKWLCIVLAAALALTAAGCSFASLNEKETGDDDTKTENTGEYISSEETSEDTTDISEETTDDVKKPIDPESCTLYDFAKENTNNSLVYEGYTVEYNVNGYDGDVFDFHIHLPQISDKSPASEKWNDDIAQKYSEEFGEHLQKSAQGTNDRFFADVTYKTVTTSDVVTIYIINHVGILYTGGQRIAYDIYHYDTVNKKFLTTNEFLAYYAEGEFAGYTLDDILKVMNKTLYTSDDEENIVPLTEKDIQGVIPSVLGEGRFDVVYQGYSIETKFANRILFDDYDIYTSKASENDEMRSYTYKYDYNDIRVPDVCQCKTGDESMDGYYISLVEWTDNSRADERNVYAENIMLFEYIDFDIERSATDGKVYLSGGTQKIPF